MDVTPIIAIVDPGSLSFARLRAQDVLVLASGRLARTITHGTARLADATITRLLAIGCWSAPGLCNWQCWPRWWCRGRSELDLGVAFSLGSDFAV